MLDHAMSLDGFAEIPDFDSSNEGLSTRPRPWISERRTINSGDFCWSRIVERRLNEIVKLPFNWDGYGASSISYPTAVFTHEVIRRICNEGLVPPTILPSPCGGVQIEWHLGDYHLELLVAEPRKSYGWFSSEGDESDGVEEEFDSDFTVVGKWVAEISNACRSAA